MNLRLVESEYEITWLDWLGLGLVLGSLIAARSGASVARPIP